MVTAENHNDDENYRYANYSVANEDRSHVDCGKWFSDDKIILRTMTVILPVN